MYLVAFHPENPLKNYEKIQVIDMQKRVKKIIRFALSIFKEKI